MILIYALIWNWLYHALETSYKDKYQHNFFNITNSFVHPFYYIIRCMNCSWLILEKIMLCITIVHMEYHICILLPVMKTFFDNYLERDISHRFRWAWNMLSISTFFSYTYNHRLDLVSKIFAKKLQFNLDWLHFILG